MRHGIEYFALKKRLILGALLTLSVLLVSIEVYSQSPQSITFDDTIENALAKTKLPGYSLALVKAGKLQQARAGGTISNADGVPITIRTPMQIGSVSKSFAALAIIQLVEAEKVKLDDSIDKYLTEFTDTTAGAITLRQALSHTSGYSTIQGNHTQTDMSTDDQALARRVRDLSLVTPEQQPDQVFMYSNANYQIIGRIVEVVSGLAYHDYIQNKILNPLQMNDSFVLGGIEKGQSAKGHLPWFGGHTPIEGIAMGTGSAPQGGVVTTASDLATYAMVMMNHQDDIITAANKQLMMSPASESVSHYGLGWSLYGPLGMVWHNGSNPGFQAQLSMRPEVQDAFVFITNGGNSYGFNETSAVAFNLTLEMLELEGPRGGENIMSKVVFVVATLFPLFLIIFAVISWKKRANLVKHSSLRRWMVTLVHLVFAAAVSWALFVLAPSMFGVSLEVLGLFVPDWGLIAKTIGYTAIGLAAMRVGLMINARQKPSQ